MNRPPRFEYADEHGFTLSVEPGPGTPGDVSSVRVGGGPECRVLAEHRAKVAAGLWTGAGLPAPVILDRPEPYALFDFEGTVFTVRPGQGVDASRPGALTGKLWQPAELRRAVAVLADMADRAEAGPDPADVEELAAAIRRDLHPDSGRPSESDRTAARAALAWMQQRGEGRDA